MKELGIYIHIPFCVQKCYYCDFVSYANKLEYEKKYIENLKFEIQAQKSLIEKYNITSIYIGGGTPSVLESKYINEILNEIKNINEINFENSEITIEINPGAVTLEKLEDYKKIGINRISIGLQAVQDEILKRIGRIHTWKEFCKTYQNVLDVGFENINVDLMIGLPEQTIQDVKESLEKVLEYSPKHISVYSLILEEGTKMEELIKKGIYKLPDEEIERMQYKYVKNTLELKGYDHYEISNFSQKGYHSKHNENCWKQKEYIGFGVAAHSYINKIRFSNTNKLDEYINYDKNDFDKFNIEKMIKKLDKDSILDFPIEFGNRIIYEKQNKNEEEKEYMLLGLRKIEGISILEFKQKFFENPIYLFRKELDKLVKEELIEIDLDNIKLTQKGLDFANIVWEEFV